MSKSLSTPEFKKRLASLTAFLSSRLGLKSIPSLEFKDDAQNASQPFGFSGYYSPTEHKITIYVTDRHENDILRTFSHEMIHHWQNERGMFTGDEYQGKGYAQKDEKMRKMEKQAFLLGCLYYRDWQDQNR